MIDVDLNISYQNDYMTYQEFIMQGYDFGEKCIVYVSGTEDYPFCDEWGITGQLNNGKTITQDIWLRDKDEYKKVKVTFNRDGIIEVAEEETVKSFDEISKAIEDSETLGNPEEYLKILELQGREEDVKKVRQQYEYFMNNRIHEMEQQINEETIDFDLDEVMRDLLDDEEFGLRDNEDKIAELYEGEIDYNGVTIYSDGMVANNFGQIVNKVPVEVMESIELAIEQGELVLTDAQRKTLLNVKQKQQNKEISEEDFKVVAEESMQEKGVAFNGLKQASKENEKDENIQNQGE